MMQWWRVEVNDAGRVVSCTVVEKSEKRTSSVRYVRAETRQQAIDAAERFHERRKAHQRASTARLHARRRAEGKCLRCEKPIGTMSEILCNEHAISTQEGRNRSKAGLSTPRAKGDPVAMHAREVEYQRRVYRLTEPLPDLLERYDALDGTASAFRDWLVQSIDDINARFPLPEG